MLLAVVAQVAARAQGRQVGRVVVRRVLVEVGAAQDRGDEPPGRPVRPVAKAQRPPALVEPLAGPGVEPAALPDHQHPHAVRPAAPLAAPAGALEFDPVRQRPPVGWVQRAKVGVDGHSRAPIKNLGL